MLVSFCVTGLALGQDEGDGEEDAAASRRVEFRVRTNAEEKIAQIVEVSSE